MSALLMAGALLAAVALFGAAVAQATTKPKPKPKPTGTISGAKWHDLNADGDRDAGEPGLAGWVVYIDANNNDALDAGEKTAITNAGGAYTFTGVPMGRHTIREAGDAQQLPANRGFKCSFPTNAGCEHTVVFWTDGTGRPDHKPTKGDTCDDRSRLEDAIEPCQDDEFDDECATGDSGKGDSHSSKGGQSDSRKGDSRSSKGGHDGGKGGHSGGGKSHGGKSHDGKSYGSASSGKASSASASSFGMARAFLSMIDSEDVVARASKGGGDDSNDDSTGDRSNDNSGHDTAGDTNSPGGKDCAVDGVDFGNYKEASVSGRKVNDANDNGKADKGESGLAGFTFFVDANDNGTLDAGEKSATSGADGSWTITGLRPGAYKVREVARPGWVCTSDPCVKQVTLSSGQTVDVVFTNRNLSSAIEVIKKGPATAQHGQSVTFTYEVRNKGEQPLSDVAVSDDKCSPVTLSGKAGGDSDDLLEGPEVWTFTCTTTVPAHAAGEANPMVNTATVTGKDQEGDTVTDQDTHNTTVEHPSQPEQPVLTPRIAIEKSGPGTARAGDSVTYTLIVSNPGDVSFAADKVALTDEMCAPSLLAKRQGDGQADGSPGTLDKGDQWFYTCTVVTQPAWTGVVNVALVRGTTPDNRTVVANDDATTTLTRPQIQVLPETIVSGRARLRGPSGCVGRTFRAVVTGRQVRSVTFEVDGRRVKRFGAGKTRYSVRINTRGLGSGVHRVTARVRFRANSRTPARTLRFVFQRCARQVILPRFTG